MLERPNHLENFQRTEIIPKMQEARSKFRGGNAQNIRELLPQMCCGSTRVKTVMQGVDLPTKGAKLNRGVILVLLPFGQLRTSRNRAC